MKSKRTKIAIVITAFIIGLILPFHSFQSIIFLIVMSVILFSVGLFMPYLININSLSNRIDSEKTELKSKISIHKSNSISYWIAVFIAVGSLTNFIKYLIIFGELSGLALIIMAFSIGILVNFLKIQSTKT